MQVDCSLIFIQNEDGGKKIQLNLMVMSTDIKVTLDARIKYL